MPNSVIFFKWIASRKGPCTCIRLEQAVGELVFHVGEDDRSVTLDYELKGSVRGKRKVAELMELVERLNDG